MKKESVDEVDGGDGVDDGRGVLFRNGMVVGGSGLLV